MAFRSHPHASNLLRKFSRGDLEEKIIGKWENRERKRRKQEKKGKEKKEKGKTRKGKGGKGRK